MAPSATCKLVLLPQQGDLLRGTRPFFGWVGQVTVVELALFAASEEVLDTSVALVFDQIHAWHIVANTTRNCHLHRKMGRMSAGGSRTGAPFASCCGVETERLCLLIFPKKNSDSGSFGDNVRIHPI